MNNFLNQLLNGAQTTTGGYTTSPLFNMGLRLMSTPSNGLQGLATGLQDASQSMQQNDVARQDLQKKTLDDNLFKQVFTAEVPTQDAVNKYMQQGGKLENAMKVLNMASGMQLSTGHVMNPFTGEQTHRDPDGTVDYQANKAAAMAQVVTDAAVNQYNALSPVQWESWKRQNEVLFKQDMEKANKQYNQQDKLSEDTFNRVENTANNTALRTDYTTKSDTWQKVQPQYTQLNDALPRYENAKSDATALVTKYPNILVTAADKVKDLYGTEAASALNLFKANLTPIAMAMHNGGVMTKPDFDNYMDAQGSATTNLNTLLEIINRNQSAAQNKWDEYNGYKLQAEDAGKAMLKQPTQSQGRSDSGASMSNSGGGWGVP